MTYRYIYSHSYTHALHTHKYIYMTYRYIYSHSYTHFLLNYPMFAIFICYAIICLFYLFFRFSSPRQATPRQSGQIGGSFDGPPATATATATAILGFTGPRGRGSGSAPAQRAMSGYGPRGDSSMTPSNDRDRVSSYSSNSYNDDYGTGTSSTVGSHSNPYQQIYTSTFRENPNEIHRPGAAAASYLGNSNYNYNNSNNSSNSNTNYGTSSYHNQHKQYQQNSRGGMLEKNYGGDGRSYNDGHSGYEGAG